MRVRMQRASTNALAGPALRGRCLQRTRCQLSALPAGLAAPRMHVRTMRCGLQTRQRARRAHLAPVLLEALALVGRQRGQRGLLLLGARGGGRRRRVQRQVHRDGRPRRLPRRAPPRRSDAAAGACVRLHHPAAGSPLLPSPPPFSGQALTLPPSGHVSHAHADGPAARAHQGMCVMRTPMGLPPARAPPWRRTGWRARGPPCAASPRTSAASSCARSSCGSRTGPPQSPQSASPPPAAASAPARARPAAPVRVTSSTLSLSRVACSRRGAHARALAAVGTMWGETGKQPVKDYMRGHAGPPGGRLLAAWLRRTAAALPACTLSQRQSAPVRTPVL
jgi:hypothetical protein